MKQDIRQRALFVGLKYNLTQAGIDDVEREIKEAVAEEREACAGLGVPIPAERVRCLCDEDYAYMEGWRDARNAYQSAIRAGEEAK